MKNFKRVLATIMVVLMVLTSAPLNVLVGFDWKASAVNEEYNLLIEETCAGSFTSENSTEGMISFFSKTEFDGCYGNQLSDVAREVYDSLVKNYVTDMNTGKYTYVFKTPFTFNAEISGGKIEMNEEREEVQFIISSSVQAAMDAFLYDYPEVFWLMNLQISLSLSVTGSSKLGYTGSIKNVLIIPVEIYSGASSKASEYNSAVESAIDSITVSDSRYDTLKNIHDYICNNAWYNMVAESRVYSSEPFFIGDGGVVCEGYAKAFKVICDRLEIPCALVSGNADGAHMWNYVQMEDDKWYLVDATWDDQEGEICDTYFLANANTIGFKDITISEERTEKNDFSGTGVFSFTYPVLSSAAYIIHVHEWDGEYTVDVEPTCTSTGSKSKACSTCGYTATETIAKLPHSEAEAVIENKVEAKCAVKGSYDEVVYCSVCDTELSRTAKEIPALEHVVVVDEAVAPTCTNTGLTVGNHCSVCGETLIAQETIPVLGHAWDEGVFNPDATCNDDGVVTFTCSVCEETITEVVTAKGHTPKEAVTENEVAATCTADGSYDTVVYCSVCDVQISRETITVPVKEHNITTLEAVSATCTETGLTEGKKCSICGTVTVAQKTVAKLAHSNKTTTIKATLSKNGKTESKCTACGYVSKTTTIYYPKSISLSATAYAYNGKAKTPSVTVKDYKGKTLKKDTDYTVKYESGRKAPGKYTVQITFKGNYSGTKNLYFTIAPTAPAKLKATQSTSAIKLSWSKVTGATGYRVYKYNSKTKKYEKLKDVTATSLTISKLSAGMKYKFKVKAYTKDGDAIWGDYSAVFATATKPSTPTLKVTSTAKKKAALTWSNVSGESGYQIYYSTKKDSGFKKYTSVKTNTTKATVSKLTSGKTYYFKVRAYTKTDSGTVYSSWSAVKSVKVK